MTNIPIIWTSHITNNTKEKESLENTIKSSTTIRERLKSIIEEKEKMLYKASILPSTYKGTDWAIERARYDGRLLELSELKNLISF
jgi:hypothetical protein